MNWSEGFAPANGLVLSPPSGSMSSTCLLYTSDFGVRVGGGEGLCDLVDVRLQAVDKVLGRQSQTLHLEMCIRDR